MAEEGKNVRLVSVEGESYEIPVDVAKMSDLVKNMIDDVSEHNFLQYYYSLFLWQHCLSHTLYGLRFVLSFMSGLFNVSSKHFPNDRIKMKMRPKKFLFQM